MPVDDLIEVEQFFLDELNGSLYNIGTVAGAAMQGRKLSVEHRKKIGEASVRLGLKPPNHTGFKRSPETCRKISETHKGHKFSDESIDRMRTSHLGVKRSPESIENSAAAHRGMKRSVESRVRMKAAQNKPETKAKRSASIKAAWAKRKGVSVDETGVPLTLMEF